jgi:hypothetical protein
MDNDFCDFIKKTMISVDDHGAQCFHNNNQQSLLVPSKLG